MVNDYWLVPTWVIIIIWIHPWYIAIILGNFPMCLAKHRSTTPHLSRCGTPWGDLADVPGLVVVIGGEDFGISFAERLLSFGQKTGLQEIHRRKDGGCSIAMFDYQRVVPEKPSTSQDCRRGWLQKETWEVYIYISLQVPVVSIVVHGDYCQWIGFVGKIYCRKPLIFRFLIWGFPVKLSQKPIHWYCRWLQMIRCKLSLFSLAHRPGMLESGRTRASS